MRENLPPKYPKPPYLRPPSQSNQLSESSKSLIHLNKEDKDDLIGYWKYRITCINIDIDELKSKWFVNRHKLFELENKLKEAEHQYRLLTDIDYCNAWFDMI